MQSEDKDEDGKHLLVSGGIRVRIPQELDVVAFRPWNLDVVVFKSWNLDIVTFWPWNLDVVVF